MDKNEINPILYICIRRASSTQIVRDVSLPEQPLLQTTSKNTNKIGKTVQAIQQPKLI